MIALLAIAIVVLAILAAHLGTLARQEDRAQSKLQKPDPKFTYRFRGYDETRAINGKHSAALRERARRKAADADVISLAQRRRS